MMASTSPATLIALVTTSVNVRMMERGLGGCDKIAAMRVFIDHKLRIARSELPADVEDLIVDALTIPNLARQRAKDQGIWGWQRMAEVIELYEWSQDSTHLILPRGFLDSLVQGLADFSIRAECIDNRTWERVEDEPLTAFSGALRPWQKIAQEWLLRKEQGIWQAPAGSGKTVGILAIIGMLHCSSIVIVNTLDILKQWEDRAKHFLDEDYPIGVIGGGKFEVSDYLTIATAQTLNSRFTNLEQAGFFDQFSFVFLDECHHATADTFFKLLNRFSARYRFGASATPEKTGDFAIAEAVLGPIIHVTHPKDVSTIIKPLIYRIPTEFGFEFRGSNGPRQSNYPELIEKLTTDNRRNFLIVASILLNTDRHILVCSNRLVQLEIIARTLEITGYPHLILTLTGEDSKEARKAAIDYAAEHPCVLLSTLADEALDIPRLDALFLVYPQRNTGIIEQQIGRIARSHPEKANAVVFDFCDPVGPLEAQWLARRREVYQKHGYEIQTVLPRDVMDAAFVMS